MLWAGNSSDDTATVKSVQALGPIGGQINASYAIEFIRSGSAVTATLSAPSAAVPVEHDTAMADQFPLPDVPQSSMDQVLAQAQEAYDQALQSKADRQAEAQDERDRHAADRVQAAVEIVQARRDAAAQRRQLEAEAAAELAEALDNDQTYFRERRQKEADGDAAQREQAREDRVRVEQERAEDEAESERKYRASQQEHEKAQRAAVAARDEINANRFRAYADMHERQVPALNWAYAMLTWAEQSAKDAALGAVQLHRYPEYAWSFATSIWDGLTERPKLAWNNARTTGANYLQAAYQATGSPRRGAGRADWYHCQPSVVVGGPAGVCGGARVANWRTFSQR